MEPGHAPPGHGAGAGAGAGGGGAPPAHASAAELVVNHHVWDAHGNKIALQTDKPAYVSGETVTGRVFVNLQSPVICEAIVVKMTGYEKAEWEELITEFDSEGNAQQKEKEYKGKKEFFKEKVKVFDCKKDGLQSVPPGTYEYPFSYVLPPNLPGVFKHKEKTKRHVVQGGSEKLERGGKIVYKVKATFETAAGLKKDLKAKQELVVNEAVDFSKLTPQFGEKTGKVLTCFCCPRGSVTLKCKFDKSTYTTGETAMVECDIDNQSSVTIDTMRLKLMRFITLRDNHGHQRTITDTVLENMGNPVPAHQASKQNIPLKFLGNQYPSTKGSLVSCQYRFDVECDIPWAPDVEVHLPVQIFAAPPVYWGVAPAW